jgi:SprT protein
MKIETPDDMAQLMRDAVECVRHYTKLANDKHKLSIPELKVEFTLKGTTAGKAFIGRNKIALNPTLLRENPEAFLKRTPGHEVAHFATYALHGFKDKLGNKIQPHGKEWQVMMWSLGLNNTRCHSYNTDNVPTKVGKTPSVKPPNVFTATYGTIRACAVGKVVEFD